MKMGRKSLARQIAALDEPVSKDFDPEEETRAQTSDDDSVLGESSDGLNGTEHYVDVGKSKLRKRDETALGPEYSGSKVSRKALLEDEDDDAIDLDTEPEVSDDGIEFADPEDSDLDINLNDADINSDDAFGESDMEKFTAFIFRGSSQPREPNRESRRPTASDFMSDSESGGEASKSSGSDFAETDESLLDTADQHVEESERSSGRSREESSVEDDTDQSNGKHLSEKDADSEEEFENGTEDDDDNDEEKARRTELRKIMSDEQRIVIATMSQAAKADADKGNAVKEQRKTFDSLLNIRMVLQKALIATNSMAAAEEKEANQPYEAAEEAAIKLWNTLDGLRYELSNASSNTKLGRKRKRGVELSTSSSTIWECMQGSEISVIDNRQMTLEKWSAKVRGTAALPISRKLKPTASQQSITSVLQDQLASSDHLVKRTKMPRSCAPIQRDLRLVEDPNIYDDGNFYQMLLKELVDQRRIESLTAPVAGAEKAMQWTAVKDVKTRKIVDTKASKGRKMRYTVHEKLQNFMAPEKRGSWEQEEIDGFFGSLLGQKMNLGEDNAEATKEEDGILVEEQGLMLFQT